MCLKEGNFGLLIKKGTVLQHSARYRFKENKLRKRFLIFYVTTRVVENIRFSENIFTIINDLFQLLLDSLMKWKLHFIPLRNTNLFSKGTSLTVLVITSTLIINSQGLVVLPTQADFNEIHLAMSFFFLNANQQFGT